MESALSYSSIGKDTARVEEDLKILTDRLANELHTDIRLARTTVENNRTILMNNIQSAISTDNIIGIMLLTAIQAEELPPACAHQFIEIARAAIACAVLNRPIACLVSKNLNIICRKVFALCIDTTSNEGDLKACVRMLINATSIVSRSFCLSELHAKSIEVCYRAKLFATAAEFVSSHPILEVDPKACEVSAMDIVKYFYFAAESYLQLNMFTEAKQSLLQVLSVPSHTVYPILEASLQRLELINLIVDGRPFRAPKYVSNCILKYLESESSEIRAFCQISKYFEAEKFEELFSLLKSLESTRDELLMRLADEVLKAFELNYLRKLSKAYVSLPLEQLVQMLPYTCGGMEPLAQKPDNLQNQTESLIASLEIFIQSGALPNCKIDIYGKAALFFPEPAVNYNYEEISKLQANLSVALDLASRIREMHAETISSPQYVGKSSRPATSFM